MDLQNGQDVTADELYSKYKELYGEDLSYDEFLQKYLVLSADNSAVIGTFVPMEYFKDIQNIRFHLDIDGNTVQRGCTCDMLFTVDRIIAYVSRFMTLKMGDLLYTGTPVGVGPVSIGQHLQGYLEGERVLDFYVR